MKMLIIIFAIMTLYFCNAHAEDNNRIILGSGYISCGQWLESRGDTSLHNQYKQWVFGFVSGSNYNSNQGQSQPPDLAAAVAFIDQYCTNNPLHYLPFAAAALVQETGGPKALHEWKK